MTNIPEWFKVENYEMLETENFGKENWAEQFILRFFIEEDPTAAIEFKIAESIQSFYELVNGDTDYVASECLYGEVEKQINEIKAQSTILESYQLHSQHSAFFSRLISLFLVSANIFENFMNCNEIKLETEEFIAKYQSDSNPEPLIQASRKNSSIEKMHQLQLNCYEQIKNNGLVYFKDYFSQNEGYKFFYFEHQVFSKIELSMLFPETAKLYAAYLDYIRYGNSAVRSLHEKEIEILHQKLNNCESYDAPSILNEYFEKEKPEDGEKIGDLKRRYDKAKLQKPVDEDEIKTIEIEKNEIYRRAYQWFRDLPFVMHNDRIAVSISLDQSNQAILEDLKRIRERLNCARFVIAGQRDASTNRETLKKSKILQCMDLELSMRIDPDSSLTIQAIIDFLGIEDRDNYNKTTKKWMTQLHKVEGILIFIFSRDKKFYQQNIKA